MSDIYKILSDAAARSKLPAGMRNNNPGNIKFVGQKVPGIVGPSVNTDQGDPQAVFDSPESGMAAMYRLLSKKYAGGKTTASQMIAGNMGWTPGNYEAAANVARYAGIKPDEDIGLNDPGRAAKFMRGLMRQEHGNSSNLYTDDMIARALSGNIAPAPSMPMASADGPKGQERYTVPGSMAVATSAPSTPAAERPIVNTGGDNYATPIVPGAVKNMAGMEPRKNGIADIFSLMALQGAQQQAAPVQPVQGPSPEQATALLNALKGLRGRLG